SVLGKQKSNLPRLIVAFVRESGFDAFNPSVGICVLSLAEKKNPWEQPPPPPPPPGHFLPVLWNSVTLAGSFDLLMVWKKSSLASKLNVLCSDPVRVLDVATMMSLFGLGQRNVLFTSEVTFRNDMLIVPNLCRSVLVLTLVGMR